MRSRAAGKLAGSGGDVHVRMLGRKIDQVPVYRPA
jgi:hypothetical protein